MNDTTFPAPLTTTNPQFFPWRVRDALDGPAFEALRPRTRLFAVLLSTCADTNGGSIWRSVDTFARMTGYSIRTIKRMIAELEAAGRLATEDRTGKARLKAASRTLRLVEDVPLVAPPIVEDVPSQAVGRATRVTTVVPPVAPKEYREEYREEIRTTPLSPRKRGARPRAADRRAMGPDYTNLHTAGIVAADTAVWSDCGGCGSPMLADMARCPKCGSTTINARTVEPPAVERDCYAHANLTDFHRSTGETGEPVSSEPVNLEAGEPATQPEETDDMQTPRPYAETPNTPSPAGPYAQDPEYTDVLAAYQCIRTTPLTELERDALAELDPADVLAWLAQADGADAVRGAA